MFAGLSYLESLIFGLQLYNIYSNARQFPAFSLFPANVYIDEKKGQTELFRSFTSG